MFIMFVLVHGNFRYYSQEMPFDVEVTYAIMFNISCHIVIKV